MIRLLMCIWRAVQWLKNVAYLGEEAPGLVFDRLRWHRNVHLLSTTDPGPVCTRTTYNDCQELR